jgi:FkbM family methyltransferase
MYNPFYSLIYAFALRNYLKNGKRARRAKKLYNWVISKGKGNVSVLTRTNEQRLLCNFSHRLPFYQKEFPLYDRQLSKLCHYLHDKLNRNINIIDIGANVGDTVLNIDLKNAFYLCIEGNEAFAKFIRKNLKYGYSYSLEKCYLTDDPAENNYQPKVTMGTGRLVISNEIGGGIITQTLDQLIETKYKNKRFDLVKIDTDGFDFKIIRGAKQCLQKWHPFLYFEWDKAFCKEQGEDPLSIFPILEELGYKECLLFDNFGNLFDKVDTHNTDLLKSHINNTIGDGLPYYYDVLAIPTKKDYTSKDILSIFQPA